ncbi:MAG: AAA family ATPase [Anaerolineae bacterium]
MGMGFTIAVAGKGGTGKTTLAGLIVRLLIERGEGPVLAVDADPNANLNVALGLSVEKTIGELREDLLNHIRELPPGMTKDTYLEMGIEECLVESRGVDLLVMGPGEGPRCYCAVNHVLRRYIGRLRDAYRYVVMDNEAGMEHLSRCTTQDIDVLLITSSDTPVALQSAVRIHQLVDNLTLRIGKRFLMLNNLNGTDLERLQAHVAKTGLELLGIVPRDERVLELSWQGQSLMELLDDAPALQAVGKMLEVIVPAIGSPSNMNQ